MTHRFFVAPDSIRGDAVFFSAAQAHQLRAVLRMRAGQEILVLDNRGGEYRVALRNVLPERAHGEIIERRAARGEPATQIYLYQALLKAAKLEWVLQKGTEVGIAAFTPIRTARAVTHGASQQKFARWMQIVTEAAEQAGRGKIPRLQTLQALDAALAAAQTDGGKIFILWENETAWDLRRALDDAPTQTIHLFVGPEGGWSASEIEMAQAYGARSVTLGPRILRAETAAIVAASAIFFARGEMRRATE